MAGGIRWLMFILIAAIIFAVPVAAEETAPPPESVTTPAPVGEDVVRLLELGKLLMGQNNPLYARAAMALDMPMRNAAGEQALRTFRRITKLQPTYADGWLWLGIALTETLYYSKEHPKGALLRGEERITEGLMAFRTAYLHNPVDLVCVSYYSEALMEYRRDFDTARGVWEHYARVATTDMQRVTAYTQAARACLNNAYFGKANKMPQDEVRRQYLAAVGFVGHAVKLCPKSPAVMEMQALLAQHRKALLE